MKKIVCLATIFLLFLTGIAFASNPIKLIINGVEVKSDVPPIVQNGRTLVPVRVISEVLGYNVLYDDLTQTVTVTAPQWTYKQYQDKADFIRDFEVAVQCLKEVDNHISEAYLENDPQTSPTHIRMAKGWLQTAEKFNINLNKYRTEDNDQQLRYMGETINNFSFYLKAGNSGFNSESQFPKGKDNFEFWADLDKYEREASISLGKLEFDILPKLNR